MSDRAVFSESRCALVLNICTVPKYFPWCEEELPAPLLQRNQTLVLLSSWDEEIGGEWSCLCRRKQGACEPFFRAWLEIKMKLREMH